jgi:hypothetical protein
VRDVDADVDVDAECGDDDGDDDVRSLNELIDGVIHTAGDAKLAAVGT